MDTAQKEETLSVLSSVYWPNLHYFYYVANAEAIVIDVHEHYEKQSYRNRCRILSANGPLDLSIPVEHPGKACSLKDVKLSNRSWKAQHFTALKSAYGKAPYFEFFADDIKSLYAVDHETLLAFNTAQLQFILKALRLKTQVRFSNAYVRTEQSKDLRALIHPKKDFRLDLEIAEHLQKPYYQGFSERFGFCANLSILDLLFNKGLDSVTYLRKRL